MACSHYREACFIDFREDVDCNSVNYVVRASVDDDALYVRQRLELCRCDVVRVYLAVYAQCTDCPGHHCVFVASKVKNYNHVLFHSL